MKWFFAINNSSPVFNSYAKLIKVAVYTALKNTSLEGFCIYDGDHSELIDWLEKHDVHVIHHRSSHYERICERHSHVIDIAAGAFLRLEIPKLLEMLHMEDEYILYTDCDVMFLENIVEELQSLTCKYFAAAPEHDPDNWSLLNSGVMYMNIRNLREIDAEFNNFVHNNIDEIIPLAFDQGAYNLYFAGQWDKLNIKMNWKTYWPVSPNVKILHFHGPKPTQIEGLKNKALPPQVMNLVNANAIEHTKLWLDAYEELLIEENSDPVVLKEVEELRLTLSQIQSDLEISRPEFYQNISIRLSSGSNSKPEIIRVDASGQPFGVAYAVDLETEKLPFPDRSVQSIYSSHLIQHLSDPIPLFQEMSRICMDGASIEQWVPYSWHNSAFLIGNKNYYNEDHYMHMCVHLGHLWQAGLGARWLLKELVYFISPDTLIELYRQQISLDFAIRYYTNIVREFGVFIEIRHNYSGATMYPQYSFITEHNGQRYPIYFTQSVIDDEQIVEAINSFSPGV